MKKFYIIFLLLLLSSVNVFAQETPSFITDSLDIYVERALEQWQIPGAAVLVVKDGKVVIVKGYGVKELGSNDKIDENTLFMIGSNTKAFTGTALALLEHEKKLKLEDKVIKYLSDFKMKDEWVTNELNLIDIISHRMGMETFQGDFMYWTSDLTSDEVLEKFGKLTPLYNFRTKYGYTNAGYAIAGKVIEKISGLKWEDYLKERLFLPLKMNSTTALSTDYFESENIAKPHTYVEGKMSLIPFQNIDNLAPCGSIGSSVNEISHWIIAQLDSGRYDGENVIPYNVIERTRYPQTIVRRSRHPFNQSNFTLYGLGWSLEDYEGKEIVSHTGGVNGFVTSVTLVPSENLGIVVLTNNDQNAFFQMLKWEIIDAYLGLPYRNYNDFVFQRAIKQKEQTDNQVLALKDSANMNIKPEFDLYEVAGRYINDIYGYADLIQKENYLELILQHHSRMKGKLEYIGNNRFLCTYSDPAYGIRVFPFEIENGKVKAFDLYVDNFIEFLPYKFVKE
ncbi:MAG: beta-lactamase family protein [Ignavibacteriaceae bacterium]|nr:beta-lactamase family protein [Ignavibacteriaceae bacterium]